MSDPFSRISKELATSKSKDIFSKIANEQKAQLQTTQNAVPVQSILPEQTANDLLLPEGFEPIDLSETASAFKSGLGKSAGGILLKPLYDIGSNAQKKERKGLEYVAEVLGEIIGDIPAFAAGAAIGGAAGGSFGAALGSVVPGIGTALGGAGGTVVGAGAGAMALPRFIKESYKEYQDFVDKGGKLSFGEFVKAAGRVAKETGKSGAIGGLFGVFSSQLAKTLPFISKIPKMDKILATKPGKFAVSGALDVAALTGAETAVNRELPTPEQVFENAAMLFAMKLGHGGLEKAKQFTKKPLIEPKKTAQQRQAETKRYEIKKRIADKLLPESVREFAKEKGLYPKSPEYKEGRAKFEEFYKDVVGTKNAKMLESKMDWEAARNKYETKHGKFKPEELKDMLYYGQKTGNPNYGEADSFTDVSKRLPEPAKKFMDEVVRPHINKSLEAWNSHPETKNIKPRIGLEEYYLPGMYKNVSSKQLRKLQRKLKTRFKLKNPFSNQKTFLTYNEAALEAGLKPLYENPIDLMKRFDEINIKMMSNAEVKSMVKEFQKNSGDSIIVTADKPSEYNFARDNGYIEFEDPFLSSYKKDGEWVDNPRPALVKPEFADVFKGIFTKEAFKPDSSFWKVADKVKNEMNYASTLNSLFHGIAEFESAIGAKGSKAFNMTNIAKRGRALRANKEVMSDAVRHGLTIRGPKELEIARRKGSSYLGKAYDALEKGDKTGFLRLAKKGSNSTFEELIPNLKITTYNDVVKQEMSRYKNKLTPQETKQLKYTVADYVNNIYGGQNWELDTVFRDPKNLKKLRRTFAFGDWTTSALKQALSALKPGLPGNLARKYLAKYLLGVGASTSLLRTFLGGFEQTDKENNSIAGVRWNPEKALNALKDIKTGKGAIPFIKSVFSFPLPDLPIRWGKKKDQVFNLGRDEKGVRREGHLGKQLLEIGGWLKNALSTFYNKANPVFVEIFEQLVGVKPTPYGLFFKEMGYYGGQKKAWGSTKPGSAKEWANRAKSIVKRFVPFSLRNGASQFLASAFGSFPIAKQYTTFKAADDIENALLNKDKKEGKAQLEGIKALLKENNFSDSSIKKAINKTRNQLIKAGELKDFLTLKKAEPKIEKLLKAKDYKELNKLKKELIEENGYTKRGVNNKISSVKKKLNKSFF